LVRSNMNWAARIVQSGGNILRMLAAYPHNIGLPA
jgi:hypothetical protein